jgi:signal transduction histidine kinase
VPLPQRHDELRDLVASVNVLADQLDESRRAIERAERLALLGQLSGGLAHQLRNSVTGARMAVQLHERQCHDDCDSLDVALRQLTLTESHLQRFLTVGQPTAPQRVPCDLRHVVDDVAQLVGPACRHKSVDLQIAGRECPRELCADVVQLRQLLLNLVLNAIEAAGPQGWVRIELASTAVASCLRVLDSGPGLDERVLARLFEPFVTGKPDGIGLGLSVARQIAHAHGGAIHYQSGRPTCFEVLLPHGTEHPATLDARYRAGEPRENMDPSHLKAESAT